MNVYKKYTAKPCSLLVTDTTLPSDKSSRFRKIFSEITTKLIMTTDNKIKDKNNNTIFTEELQKYQHYHQVKLINMNILQVNKYDHLVKVL